MAQYFTGTVNVTNGSAVVTGVGTEWLANVTGARDYLVVLGVAGEDIHRLIQTVDSDTQLTLAAPFGGLTDTGRTYVIIRDFTANNEYPLMDRLDQAFQEIWNLAMTKIDDDINQTPFTLPVPDTSPLVEDNVDPTKQVRIDVGDTPTATLAALFMPSEDVDFRAPARSWRRLIQEPIEGNSLTGNNTFDGNPNSPTCMLGELLQCDNSSQDFDMFFDPDLIVTPDNWQGLLCWLRPISGNNLASISVAGSSPGPGFDLSWQNGYVNANQTALTIYMGYEQSQANGYIIPVFKRSDKIIAWGALREFAGQDLQLRFGTSNADAQGGQIINYQGRLDLRPSTYTFTEEDAGKLRGYGGSTPATWTVPNLSLNANRYLSVEVVNFGTSTIDFVASSVTFLQPLTTLPAGGSCVVQWFRDPLTPNDFLVKITGELV